MIELAVITAPRMHPTINQSLKAIRYGGYNGKIHIFAEPDIDLLYLDPLFSVHRNETKLGCFGNYNRALTWMVENSEAEYIAVLGDDFDWKRATFIMAEQAVKRLNKLGYAALYTPQGVGIRWKLQGGWQEINLGWGNTWGGNYVFKKDVAKQIIDHPYYQKHLETYKKNEQVDHCIPEVIHQLGLNQYFHTPSFCDHIGKISTIGHQHTQNERGWKFKKN